MNEYLKRLIERVKNEPVMVATAVAIAAMFLFDLGPEERSLVEQAVQAIIVLLAGGAARQKVTPTRKLKRQNDANDLGI